MGKPEEIFEEEEKSTDHEDNYRAQQQETHTQTTKKRLMRDPDNRILGGVAGGFAAYMDWDPTAVRIVLFLLMFFYGITVPLYFLLWIIVPMARTATEKLEMRGQSVTVENIGKTVTDGFEKVANGVNDYMRSDKPRTFLQKLGDALVMIVGWFLKICLVIFAIICSPVLFVFGVVFVALLFAAIAVAVGGGAALISFFPMADVVLPTSPLSAIVMYIAGILLVGIPLVSLVWAIFSQIFKWQPMNSGLKWTLVILWIVSAACFGICFAVQGATFPELGIFNF